MSAALTSPAPAEPSRISQVLDLLRRLVGFGRDLAISLRENPPTPIHSFGLLHVGWGTTNIDWIIARITRGLKRAAALQAWLTQRAERGRDLTPSPLRMPSVRAAATDEPAAARAPAADVPAAYAGLSDDPTAEEIDADMRRRPIGALIADICLDIGIMPGKLTRDAWTELASTIIQYGGNLASFLLRMGERAFGRNRANHLTAEPVAWLAQLPQAAGATSGHPP